MGMIRPGSKPRPDINSEAARAFLGAAASTDRPDEARPRRTRTSMGALVRLTLLLPPSMLKDVDAAVARTATPRLVWIRQAIQSALDAAQSERLKAATPCALARRDG